MIRNTNLIALIAAMVLGVVAVLYVRAASGPSQPGPTAVALVFITGAAVVCLGGAILPWKKTRIALLASVVVVSFALGIVSFSSGVGLLLGAIVAGVAMLWELKDADATEGIAVLIGSIGGFVAVSLAWMMALNLS